MKASFSLSGGPDLAKRLQQLPDALSRDVQLAALKAGAEPIRAAAAVKAPRSHGPGPHMADDIVIGVTSAAKLEKQGRFTETVVVVGPSHTPHDHFYGLFQEYGTAHHAAQPFMRPAFDTEAQASLARILAALWAKIRKALPQSFSSAKSGVGI